MPAEGHVDKTDTKHTRGKGFRSLAEMRSIVDGDPVWTKTGSFTMGLDPLGLQATSIRIYQGLVPNVTNITNRLRYYSFFPWLVDLYAKLHHSTDQKRFAVFMRRGEAIFALASVVHDLDGSDGLGGANWAFQRREEAKAIGIDLKPSTDNEDRRKNYLLANRGNFGVAYAPTLVTMKWLTSSVIPVVDGVGRSVADAFAASIGSVASTIEQVIKSGVVSAQQLEDIGAAVHPAKIPSNSAEQKLLREFLTGNADGDENSAHRSSTIWLVLDLISKGVDIGDMEALRRAFYHRILPDGRDYNVTGRTIDQWRAYLANEYGHLALHCALNGLVGLQCEDYPAGVEPRQLIAELVDSALPPIPDSWPEWSLAQAIEGEESEIAGAIRGELLNGERPTSQAMLDAFKLLAILWAKWNGTDGDTRQIIAVTAGTDTRSLEGIFRTIDTVQDQPVADVLAEVIYRHIIIDHQIIAGRKLAAAGTFTYHFLIEDGLLSEGRLGQYGYTTPRLGNLMRVLRDAGYLDANGVTRDGEAFLDREKPL